MWASSLQRESQSAGHHHHRSLTDSALHRSVDGAVGTQAAVHGGRKGDGSLLLLLLRLLLQERVKGCAVSLLQLNYTLLISSCRTQSDREEKGEKNTNLKKNNRLNQENNLVTLGWKSLTRKVCRTDCAHTKQVHRFGPLLKCKRKKRRFTVQAKMELDVILQATTTADINNINYKNTPNNWTLFALKTSWFWLPFGQVWGRFLFLFLFFSFIFFKGRELLLQYVAPWAVISHVSALLP